MAENIKIVGDIDKVYTNINATCYKIASYIYSKGDIKTNKVSNKFYNIEILQLEKSYYLAVTSGRLGGNDIQVQVRRYYSEPLVKKLYLDECQKKLKAGYHNLSKL